MGQFCQFRLARFTGVDRLDAKPLTLRDRGTDIYLCMSALRLGVTRKVGSIVYGLLAGFATAMAFGYRRRGRLLEGVDVWLPRRIGSISNGLRSLACLVGYSGTSPPLTTQRHCASDEACVNFAA